MKDSSRRRNPYVRYNDPAEVAYLDQNTFDASKAVVFPGHMYAGNVVPSASFITDAKPFQDAMRPPGWRSKPRDTQTHYIYGVERMQHPDHFSRFGYGRRHYGYSEQRPGTYDEPGEDCNMFLPEDMAPKRFYSYEYSGHNINTSQASADLDGLNNIEYKQ